MARIKITLKSNSNDNFHTELIYNISKIDAYILKQYDDEMYDEVWDHLCDRIERESIPEALDPDWYIDHIDYLD